MGLPFTEAKTTLLGMLPALCKRYLPHGKKSGDWWLASVPWRHDKNPSLGVSLTSGRWFDFADPDSRGDIIDLIAKIENVSTADVVRRVVS